MFAFSSRSRFMFCAFFLPTLFTLASCKNISDGTVTGKVKLDNEPLTSATVYFVCVNGETLACNVGLDGSYKMEKVPFGLARIKVVTYRPPLNLAPKDERHVAVPAKYNDENTSGLSFEVIQGRDKYDIQMFR